MSSGCNSSSSTEFYGYRNAVNQTAWSLDISSGKPRIFIGNDQSAGGPYSLRSGSLMVNDGHWHHIARVWVPGSRLGMFVDGQLANGTLSSSPAATYLSSLPTATGTAMRIGVSSFQGDHLYAPFRRAIDGVRYTLGARYPGGFTPDLHPVADASTIAVWNFDEGDGTTTVSQGTLSASFPLLNGAAWTFGPS